MKMAVLTSQQTLSCYRPLRIAGNLSLVLCIFIRVIHTCLDIGFVLKSPGDLTAFPVDELRVGLYFYFIFLPSSLSFFPYRSKSTYIINGP